MHPLVVVCVQGLGPQLVQVTISFGPVVAPVGGPPSRFFLPCDRVSVEETYILTIFRVNNDPSFDQFFYSSPFSVILSPFLFLSFRFVSFRFVRHSKDDRYVDDDYDSLFKQREEEKPVAVQNII